MRTGNETEHRDMTETKKRESERERNRDVNKHGDKTDFHRRH